MAEAITPPERPAGGEGDTPPLPPGCAAVRDALYRRADGEALSPAEAAALDRHLEGCESCAAELRRSGEFSSHISELLGGLRPPGDIRRKVLDRIGPLGGRRRTVTGAAALAGVALVGLVALVLSGGKPLARVAAGEGEVRVLEFSAGEWRVRTGAREVRRGERVELAPGAAATLAVGESEIELGGPALVQLAKSATGRPVVHCIRRTKLSARVDVGARLEVRAGEVRLVTEGTEGAEGTDFTLDVAADGGCRLTVRAGEVRAADASGERRVEAGETAVLAQPGTARGP